MTTRFISDQHAFHVNVIGYCKRPFSNIDEMNNFMIKEWNSIVKPEDTTLVLGDVCMGKKENIPKFVSKLQGHKILILGNHDRSAKFMLDSGFDEVHKTLIYYHQTETESYDILLTHHPQLDQNELIPKGLGVTTKLKYCFHGHLHGKLGPRTGPYTFDVGVDCGRTNPYQPKTIEEIVQNG